MGLKLVSWTAHAPPTRLFDSLPNFARSLSRTKRSRSHHEATFFSSNNRAGASDALLNCRRRQASAPRQVQAALAAAPTRLLLPVTQPPQVNPMIANAAAPLTPHGGLDRGLGFHGVSSFDAISGRQRRRRHGMNRLGKYSFPRHRQEARSGSACGLVAQAAAIAVRIRVGRDLEPSSYDCCAMVVDRALADAEIAAMFLLGVRQAPGPRSGADDWSTCNACRRGFPQFA